MPDLLSAVQSYLCEVLGFDTPEVRPWSRDGELPYFLRDAFLFRELELLGHPVLLAIDQQADKPRLAELRTRLDKVAALAGRPVVYVTGALASYERKRLIEQKVPFIVPGNQLYLPDLGIDLREYFRQRSPAAVTAFSPSTQALLLTALLRQPWQSEWQVSAMAADLGYTAMTLSRAVKELTAGGLAEVYSVGRSRWLRMDGSPQAVWERAAPMLRSPLKRTFWAYPPPAIAGQSWRLAGLSALAKLSMLDEPRWPVYAMSQAQWKVATEAAATEAGMEELPEPVSGAWEWQLWRYGPALLPEGETVDALSLLLSLRDDADERVQLALDDLKAFLPW